METPKNYINSIAIDKDKAKDIKAIAIDDKKLLKVEDKALLLIEVLKADANYLAFYCKVIHKLTESQIQYILEGARKADSPARYFARAASIEMSKNPR